MASCSSLGCTSGLSNLYHALRIKCLQECVSNYEHMGQIVSVTPIIDDLTEVYEGKCYHVIKLADGSSFKLIFSRIDFSDLEERLQPGSMIKITYRMPNYLVTNIYPCPKKSSKVAPLQMVLDDEELTPDNAMVRAFYIDDELKAVHFINSMEEM